MKTNKFHIPNKTKKVLTSLIVNLTFVITPTENKLDSFSNLQDISLSPSPSKQWKHLMRSREHRCILQYLPKDYIQESCKTRLWRNKQSSKKRIDEAFHRILHYFRPTMTIHLFYWEFNLEMLHDLMREQLRSQASSTAGSITNTWTIKFQKRWLYNTNSQFSLPDWHIIKACFLWILVKKTPNDTNTRILPWRTHETH